MSNWSFLEYVCGFLLTGFTYSIIEYTIHRFLLHYLFYSHHKKHHTYPNKLSIIHTPMSIITIAGIINYIGVCQVLSNSTVACLYAIGPCFYLAFEITHLLSHGYTGSNNIILNAKYFHKLHHVTDNCNYGFTMPFWDYVFGTLSPQWKLTVAEIILGWMPFWSFALHTRVEV